MKYFSEGLLMHYHKGNLPEQLDVFRIGIALYSILSFCILLLDFKDILHPNGIINWEVSNANLFWFELHWKKIANFLGIEEVKILLIASVLYLTSLISLLIGKFSKIAAISSFLCYYTFSNVMSIFGYGADIYQNVALFLICFFPIGYYYSIDKKKLTTKIKDISLICIRSLQVYLIITYFASGIEKLVLRSWWNGSYLYSVMNDPTMYSLTGLTKYFNSYLLTIIGVIVIISEAFYGILIWIPSVRIILFFSIVGMHLFIGFFLSMPMFALIMIILNIVCWYPALFKDFQKLKKK